MAIVQTKLGPIDESLLDRLVIFKDQPGEFTIEEEYRLKLALDVPGTEIDGAGREISGVRHGDAGELVKRSAHVVLKEPSVIAAAIVGGF